MLVLVVLVLVLVVLVLRMQHFGQNKKDFGMFSRNPPVTCFVIRIRK